MADSLTMGLKNHIDYKNKWSQGNFFLSLYYRYILGFLL